MLGENTMSSKPYVLANGERIKLGQQLMKVR